MSAPYDEHIGTHWEGCETTHGHSECAARVIAELRAERDEYSRAMMQEENAKLRLEHEMAEARAEAAIGKAWKVDSSLEKWFPYTAEELTRLRAELAEARETIQRLDRAGTESTRVYNEVSAERMALRAELARVNAGLTSAITEIETTAPFTGGMRDWLTSIAHKLRAARQPAEGEPT